MKRVAEGEVNNGKMKRVAEQKRKVDQEIETAVVAVVVSE